MDSSYIDKGTLITLEDGSTVAIEDLKVGDKVQSYNMASPEFDMSHIGNSEQIPIPVIDIMTETIPGEDVYKLVLSNGSTLSVSETTLYSAESDKGVLELYDTESDNYKSDSRAGMSEISVGDLIYIDSGEMLENVVVEGVDKWARSREMCSIWIEGGDTVFANEVLVSVNRRLTEEEEEKMELARLEAVKLDEAE